MSETSTAPAQNSIPAANVSSVTTPVTPDATTSPAVVANSVPAASIPATPAVEAPAPITPAPPAPTTTETPAVEPAPVAPPADVLLAPDAAKPETKPVDAKPDAPEVKADDAPKPAEPAPLPTYELTLPEGIKADDAVFSDFQKHMGEFENLTKADHAQVKELSQKLLDRHVGEMTNLADRFTKHIQTSWENTKNEWKDTFEKDAEIGGNRRETTLKSANNAISRVRSADQQKALYDMLRDTGVGNHPALIGHLAALGDLITKYETEVGVKPLPANPAMPKAPKGINARIQKMYSS